MTFLDSLTAKLGLEDELTFGKHKGKTIEKVCEDTPYYIQWCLENVSDFTLDPMANAFYVACLRDEVEESENTRLRNRRSNAFLRGEDDPHLC
jgi:hypothetical protein